MSLKILGGNPFPDALSDAYTVPAGREAVASSIVLCNSSTADASVRLYVTPALATGGIGAGVDVPIIYDQVVAGRTTESLTLGITLAAGDKIRIHRPAAGVGFGYVTVFGEERDAT